MDVKTVYTASPLLSSSQLVHFLKKEQVTFSSESSQVLSNVPLEKTRVINQFSRE